jgi:hypothetical protein
MIQNRKIGLAPSAYKRVSKSVCHMFKFVVSSSSAIGNTAFQLACSQQRAQNLFVVRAAP